MMTSTTERLSAMGMPAMAPMMMPTMMMPATNMAPAMSMPSGMMMPRCTMKMEKCKGGMKITCMCDDKTSAAMLQQLCMSTAGGMCGCCVMMNGMMVCWCNLTMGMCKMEMTDMGLCMTCTSADPMCEKMIQACCDCMTAMMMPGTVCCMMMNGMPVCCCVC